MNRANFKQYRNSSAVTDWKEFPGRTHWLIAGPGWEEVADYALEWATKRGALAPATQPAGRSSGPLSTATDARLL